MGVFTGITKAKKPISEGAQYLRENLKSIMDEIYKVTGGKDGYENADEYLEGMEDMPSAVRQLLTALRKDDYLGFDNPEQALRAIADDVEYAFDAFDMSPQLKGAITKASNAAQFQASKARPQKDFGRLGKAALPPVLGSIAATQTQEAEAMPRPAFMKYAQQLIDQGMPTPTAKKVASGRLPMDESSRMARAAEDWDIDQVMAHGTNSPDVHEFKISRGKLGEGVYFYPQADAERAGKRAIATRYRKKGVDQSNVIQAVPRKGLKFKEIPFNEAKLDPDLHKKYSDYDGIKWLNENGTPREIVIFDPKNVRSINAAFDPDQKQSAKILASTLAGATALGSNNEAEAAPISPVMMAAAKELSGEGGKIRQVGQKLADDYNAKNNTKLSATEYLDKKMPEAAVEMRDYTNAAVKMRGADDDAAANEILQAVRKKYGLAAPAAMMTTSPEAAILGEPVPESNLQALKTGIARGYDQTMSNEGWLLGLASALGAEGANELRAKLAEQRNPAMGDQENELVRTIGEIIGSMSPGAL